MAGRGPAPKRHRTRERDERRSAGRFEVLPADGREGVVPELPKTYRRMVKGKNRPLQFLPETRAARNAWWRSPMSVKWLASDVPTLLRLARLTDRELRGLASSTEVAEIRRLEAAFGLAGPESRRALAWEVADTIEEPDNAEVGEERREELLEKVVDLRTRS